MGGQPFGYILFTLVAAVSAQALAFGFVLAAELLEGEALPAWAVPAAKAAIALAWLPVAANILRNQAVSAAQAGGLPAMIRPARLAWIVAFVAMVLAFLLDFVTEGAWARRRHAAAGWLLPFWAAFPFLTWVAVRNSLGGPAIENKVDPPAVARPKSPFSPREPSGAPLPEGAQRDHVLAMIAAIDRVDLARPGAEVRASFDALWEDPIVRTLPADLRWNLQLAATAYCDASLYLEVLPGKIGDSAREEIVGKYRDVGIAASGDVEMLVELARQARGHAAREAGA